MKTTKRQFNQLLPTIHLKIFLGSQFSKLYITNVWRKIHIVSLQDNYLANRASLHTKYEKKLIKII